jgi:hypothetical protein
MNGPNLINNVVKVERIVTGTTHPYLGAIPTKGTIPVAETLTGTITTDNAGSTGGVIVLGTGTLFFTELYVGDFIYNGDAEIRKIKAIFSDTMLEIEEKFPASLSGAAVKRPKNHYYKTIVATSTGSADAELQEAKLEVDKKFEGMGSPLAYDASAVNAEITFECQK